MIRVYNVTDAQPKELVGVKITVIPTSWDVKRVQLSGKEMLGRSSTPRRITITLTQVPGKDWSLFLLKARSNGIKLKCTYQAPITDDAGNAVETDLFDVNIVGLAPVTFEVGNEHLRLVLQTEQEPVCTPLFPLVA